MLHHKPRLQHLGQPSEPSTPLTEPPMSPLMMPSSTLLLLHMCQLNLNTAKTGIRRAALTKKHSPSIGMRSSHSFKKNQPSPNVNAKDTVFNSYLKKNYDRNHQSSLDAYNLVISHNYGNCLGVPPHAPHIFHVHLCTTPHIVCQAPHNSTPPMLPCGECTTLLSDCTNFLPHHKTYVPCHLEASHAQPPKSLSALSHCSHCLPW